MNFSNKSPPTGPQAADPTLPFIRIGADDFLGSQKVYFMNDILAQLFIIILRLELNK